jgi:hypothetical protein
MDFCSGCGECETKVEKRITATRPKIYEPKRINEGIFIIDK